MIQLQFKNLNSLTREIETKIGGIAELTSPTTKTEIAKAVFTLTSKRFLKDFGKQAMINPKNYFHMYEWDHIGDNNQKLFKIRRGSVANGKLTINVNLKQSKSFVPLDNRLKNKRGKKSITKRSVFKNKAEVMESGKPVKFTTKQYIAFMSNDGKIHFVPPKHVINIMNPGGRATKGSFDKFLQYWYASKVDTTIRASNMLLILEKEVVKAMDGNRKGRSEVKRAIKTIANSYSQGGLEF